jgi:hypothetical protein
VDVLRKLDEMNWPKVIYYWPSPHSGVGYIHAPELTQSDASFMNELPEFTPPVKGEFKVDLSALNKFGFSTAHRPRDPELYTPPLLIVPQSPGASATTAKSYILHEPVIFNQSYYGFSSNGCSSIPVALLYLLTHSELFSYYLLATCSRMGAERRTMTKSDLENFKFPVIDRLSDSQRNHIVTLSKLLETAPIKPWDELNDFIFDLYGLDTYDRQVVRDTLEIAPPYKEARDRANSAPSRNERNLFHAELQRLLAPSFAVTDEEVLVNEVEITNQDHASPWYFFSVSSASKSSDLRKITLNELIPQVAREANKTGCSRVIVHEEGCLLVGIIGQYRYWTLSRARLCALDILRNHLDVFPVERS